MRRTKRLPILAMACVLAGAFQIASAQSGSTPPDSARQPRPEPGPVIRIPEPSGSSGSETTTAPQALRTTTDPGQAGRSGGAIVGPFWGAASDPELEAERRIKKLIRRLG